MPSVNQLTLVTRLRSYLFAGSLAINFFVQIIIVANILSISFFLYANPLTIRIDVLPDNWNAIAWIATLYVAYITMDAIGADGSSRLSLYMKVSLVGSSILIPSLLFAAVGTSTPQAQGMLNTARYVLSAVGYFLSFLGVDLMVLVVMAQNKKVFRLFLIYFLGLLIPIEMWAFAHWSAYPFDVTSNLGFAWKGAFFELQLFYLGYPLISLLLVAFLFSWAPFPLLQVATNIIGHNWKNRARQILFGEQPSESNQKDENEPVRVGQSPITKKHSNRNLVGMAILLISLVLGIFISYYPYINERPGLVGVDSLGYYYTLTASASKTPQDAFNLIAQVNSARILYFLILYGIRELTQVSAYTLIQFMPLVTLLANVLTIFWFVRRYERTLVASMVALFSLFSFHTSVAVHAGLLANWFALVLSFVAFGMTLKLDRKSGLKDIFAAVLVWVLVLLVHYWSAVFFISVLVCYELLKPFERLSKISQFFVGVSLVVLAVLIAPHLNELVPFFASYGMAQVPSSAGAAFLFWARLQILIDTWFFGAFANPVMFLLALIGIIGCFYQKTKLNRLIIAWTVCGAVFSLLVAFIGRNIDQWLLWRTLYLVPFQIPAVFGLCILVRRFLSVSSICSHKVVENSSSIRQSEGSERGELASTFLVASYTSAGILLVLGLPVMLILVLVAFFSTLIVHFMVREDNKDSIFTLVLMLFVTLLLLNYTLRTLAPLALNRLQP